MQEGARLERVRNSEEDKDNNPPPQKSFSLLLLSFQNVRKFLGERSEACPFFLLLCSPSLPSYLHSSLYVA